MAVDGGPRRQAGATAPEQPRRGTPADNDWVAVASIRAALGTMFIVGSAVAVVAAVLDSTRGAHRTAMVLVVCTCLVGAVGLVASTRHAVPGSRRRRFHAALVLGVGVIGVAVWCSHGGTTGVAGLAFFSWVPLAAFAFLPWRQAAPYVLLTSSASLAVIALSIHTAAVSCAMGSLGTSVAAALIAGYLRGLLFRSSAIDPLTGLPNRLALPGILERATARAARGDTPLAVALVDLDEFKEVNDVSGHHAGDRLLRETATHWRRQLRSGDELVRYGGDEFVVVLPGCDAGQGAQVVEKLRTSGRHPCSAGVAQWNPSETAEAALVRADVALYRAKTAGRDRVVTAPGDSGQQPRNGTSAGRRRLPRPSWGNGSPLTEGPQRVAMMLGVIGVLYLVGGLLTVPTILLRQIPHARVGLALGDSGGGGVAGLGMLAVARSRTRRPQAPPLPMWAVHVPLVAAIVAVCSGFALGKGAPASLPFLGLLAWSWMFVFALLPRRVALAYCAVGSTAAVVVMAMTVHQNPVGVALIETCTSVGAGLLIGHLRALLGRFALVDALTGLPNRGALDAILAREMAQATMSGAPLSVAVVDLDHFKRVNDGGGHRAGDEVLVRFADQWADHLRGVDTLVRYGGDEFVVVLPGWGTETAEPVLRHLAGLGAQRCSVGLAAWAPGDSSDTVLARADRAMYRAKELGRSQVAVVGVGAGGRNGGPVPGNGQPSARDAPGTRPGAARPAAATGQ